MVGGTYVGWRCAESDGEQSCDLYELHFGASAELTMIWNHPTRRYLFNARKQEVPSTRVRWKRRSRPGAGCVLDFFFSFNCFYDPNAVRCAPETVHWPIRYWPIAFIRIMSSRSAINIRPRYYCYRYSDIPFVGIVSAVVVEVQTVNRKTFSVFRRFLA